MCALCTQACKYVPGAELLQMDPSDACEKLRTLLKVLGGFKLHYFAYKTVSAAECPAHPWRFQNSVVFGRLDTFMERCADMLDLQITCMQVSRTNPAGTSQALFEHSSMGAGGLFCAAIKYACCRCPAGAQHRRLQTLCCGVCCCSLGGWSVWRLVAQRVKPSPTLSNRCMQTSWWRMESSRR